MIIWPMMLSGPSFSRRKILPWCPCLTILNLVVMLPSSTFGIPLHETSKKSPPIEMDEVIFYDTSSEKKPIFTPFWAVELQGGEGAAREIANKYGFIYIGEVTMQVYSLSFSFL